MSGNYFKATVKEVSSGDSVTVVGGAKPGTIPAEKRLTLSSLIAPKLVRWGPMGHLIAPQTGRARSRWVPVE